MSADTLTAGTDDSTRDVARTAEVFRERVGLFLRASTPHDVVYRSMRDPLDVQRAAASDIRGVPSFSIVTRTGRTMTLGEALRAAEDAARADGEPLGAAVLSRRAHDIGEAFVCVSLSAFADLLTAVENGSADHGYANR
jgi:hypothetical protein